MDRAAGTKAAYPVLHELAGGAGKARELCDQHAHMIIHPYGLGAGLASLSQWGERVRRLQDIISSPHIRDGEDTEFPRLRDILREEEHASDRRQDPAGGSAGAVNTRRRAIA